MISLEFFNQDSMCQPGYCSSLVNKLKERFLTNERRMTDINNMKSKLLPSNEKTMICNMNSNNCFFFSDDVLRVYILYNLYYIILYVPLQCCCLKYHDHLY